MIKRIFSIFLSLVAMISFSTITISASVIEGTYFKAELLGEESVVPGEKYTVKVTLGEFTKKEFLGATCVIKYNSDIFEVDSTYLSIINSDDLNGETYPIIDPEDGWVFWGANEILGENSSFNANILNDSNEITSLKGDSITFFIDFVVKKDAVLGETIFTIETDENLIGVFSESTIESKPGTGSSLYVEVVEEIVYDTITIKQDSMYERINCPLTNLDIITNFSEKTTVNKFISNFENNSEDLKLIVNGKACDDNDIVPTGAVLKLSIDGNEVDFATVVCKGDVDFDGIVNSTDYIQIKQYFLELFELSDIALSASDLDESGKIDSTDYIRLKMYFLDLYNIYS